MLNNPLLPPLNKFKYDLDANNLNLLSFVIKLTNYLIFLYFRLFLK